MLKKNKLKIVKVSQNKINGGSIRCFVTHQENDSFLNKQNLKKIKKLLKYETKNNISSKKYFINFNSNILNIKKKLISIIQEINKNSKKIYILGASTKGNTILQYLGINKKDDTFCN